MYGFLRGLLPTLNAARAAGRSWVYLDRGYFRRTEGDDYGGYFRMTRAAYQHDGRTGEPDFDRWQRLALRIAPWRRQGNHVLVCPPSDVFTQAIGGFAAGTWLRTTLSALSQSTDRPVRVRPKTSRDHYPLIDDLQDCHALVTYMSNTAVESVLAGVPVFCTGRCAASAMGKSNLFEIESPAYPDGREAWAARLAANQWTLAELAEGLGKEVFA